MKGFPISARRGAALAAFLYLLLAAWWMRDALSSPATRVMGAARSTASASLTDSDERMVLSQITRHARLLARPADLAHDGQCYPTPWSYTLGEHMFGNALLAAVPLALTGDPIVAYNAVLLLNIWIAAMGMYALTRHATGSTAAALVAGVLFGFDQTRLSDPAHPYVMGGDLWMPFVLLFLLKVFGDGRWRSVAGLAVFSCLQLGESLYAVIATLLLALAVTAWLVARDPRRFVTIAPRLVVAAIPVVALAWLVFGPYLATAATWGGMTRDTTIYARLELFAVGGPYFPGVVVTLLAVAALLDRMRGPRLGPAGDLRLVLLAAGLLVLLSAVGHIRILGVTVPSPLQLVRHHVPGLDAVRVLAAVRVGVCGAAALLAGWGVAVIVERLSDRAAGVIAGLACALALLEIGTTPFATFSFGQTVAAEAVPLRPDESDIELVSRTANGAVLDLPNRGSYLAASSSHLLLGAWHGRPTATCYNSFTTPLQEQIEELSARMPSRHAAEELAALGFRTVYVHRRFLESGFHGEQIAAMAQAASRPQSRLKPLGSSATIDAYALDPPRALHSDLDALIPLPDAVEIPGTEPIVAPPHATLTFPVVNPRPATFLQSGPPAPRELVVTWRKRVGGTTHDEHVRALLPVAIAAQARKDVELEVPVPDEPGRYDVVLAPAASPDRPLSRTTVRIARTSAQVAR